MPRISNKREFTSFSVNITNPGIHYFEWVFSKDISISIGDDQAQIRVCEAVKTYSFFFWVVLCFFDHSLNDVPTDDWNWGYFFRWWWVYALSSWNVFRTQCERLYTLPCQLHRWKWRFPSPISSKFITKTSSFSHFWVRLKLCSTGSSSCTPCNQTHYAPPGSAVCLPRPPCTSADFETYYTPCRTGRVRDMYFRWREPKICSELVPGSIHLPPPEYNVGCGMLWIHSAHLFFEEVVGSSSFCLFFWLVVVFFSKAECNPGTFRPAEDSTNCVPCPVNTISEFNAIECRPCELGTIGVRKLILRSWKEWPPFVTNYCTLQCGSPYVSMNFTYLLKHL